MLDVMKTQRPLTGEDIRAMLQDPKAKKTHWDGINSNGSKARMMRVETPYGTIQIFATDDGEGLQEIYQEVESQDLGFEKVDSYSRVGNWDFAIQVGGFFSRKLDESDLRFDENNEENYTIDTAIEEAFTGRFADPLQPGYRWKQITQE